MSVNTGDGAQYAAEVKEEMSENPFPKKRCEDKWPVFIEHFSNQLDHSEGPALQTNIHTQFYIPHWEWSPFAHTRAHNLEFSVSLKDSFNMQGPRMEPPAFWS